jgi:hypothetical protein
LFRNNNKQIKVLRSGRGISGPKKNEITQKQSKLHNDEFNNLYSSPTNVKVIRSSRMNGAGYVAHIRKQDKHEIIKCILD